MRAKPVESSDGVQQRIIERKTIDGVEFVHYEHSDGDEDPFEVWEWKIGQVMAFRGEKRRYGLNVGHDDDITRTDLKRLAAILAVIIKTDGEKKL